MEKIFPNDRMSKRERVLATLNHQSVDRCALMEQLSFNPQVIADWTGKPIIGFDYTVDDICAVIRQTMDLIMPPVAPRGSERVTDQDGFVWQHDNWTTWLASRPFDDEEGGRKWLEKRILDLRNSHIDADKTRREWGKYMRDLQDKIGETQILAYPINTGLCAIYGDGGMGLEIFSFFHADHPDVTHEFMALNMRRGLERLHAIGDEYASVSPVVLVAEDFATKQGPIFPPEFLGILWILVTIASNNKT